MATFVEYELEDGMTVLIEASESVSTGIVKAARGDKNVIVRAKQKFSEALNEMRVQARILIKEISSLEVDEAEIKFGLTTSGEAGNIAIGKIGLDINYEVTLHWKRKPKKDVQASGSG